MKSIKKGQRYLCTKDYIMGSGNLAYKSGQIYESPEDGYLSSILSSVHSMQRNDMFNKHFEKQKKKKQVLPGGNGIYLQNIPVIFETVKVDSIVESVVKKFKDRSDVGIKKYGTTLAGNDKLTTLQWIDEAQAEAMDFCLYLERLKKEFDGK